MLIYLSLTCSLVLWYKLNEKFWDILLCFPIPGWKKETIASMMTCKFGLIWHHMKTVYMYQIVHLHCTKFELFFFNKLLPVHGQILYFMLLCSSVLYDRRPVLTKCATSCQGTKAVKLAQSIWRLLWVR